MTIYQNIKTIAKRKNISQKDLAEAFGVTEQTMTNYFNGRTKITAEQLPLFAKLLRVPIQSLYEGSENVDTDKKLYSHSKSLHVNTCPECIEKQKEIDDLKIKLGETNAELSELYRKYVKALEELREKGANGTCG